MQKQHFYCSVIAFYFFQYCIQKFEEFKIVYKNKKYSSQSNQCIRRTERQFATINTDCLKPFLRLCQVELTFYFKPINWSSILKIKFIKPFIFGTNKNLTFLIKAGARSIMIYSNLQFLLAKALKLKLTVFIMKQAPGLLLSILSQKKYVIFLFRVVKNKVLTFHKLKQIV